VGDGLEIRPGREVESEGQTEWQPLETSVRSLQAGSEQVESARPGGLLGVGTGLDPSLTKGDALAGQVAGEPGTLPPTRHEFEMEVDLLERVVGNEDDESGESDIEEISTGEPLMLTVGTATTVGAVTSARDDECEVQLKRPVCAESGAQIAINRRVGARWRLIGVGTLS
jgi:translation initiation factor 2 subunit 3